MSSLYSTVKKHQPSGSQVKLIQNLEANDSMSDVHISMDAVTCDDIRIVREPSGDVTDRSTARDSLFFTEDHTNKQEQEISLAVPRLLNADKNTKSQSFNLCETLTIQTNSNNTKRCKSTFVKQNPQKRPHSIWSAADNHIGRLNTRLLDAIEYHNNTEVQSLLEMGANPNATCRTGGHISACHAAAYGNSYALHLLLQYNVDKQRTDKFGRTPLHLAAWAGRNQTIVMLLDFPIELEYKLLSGLTPEVEEEIKELRPLLKFKIDVTCELPLVSVLPKSWKDSIEHKCRRYMSNLPKFFSGWTPLHIASYAALHDTTRLLLAAGANPNSKDAIGRTPLDIVGAACLDSHKIDKDNYLATINNLIDYGGQLNTEETSPSDSGSALHVAVELCNVEAIIILLAAGAPVTQRNLIGNTPLHDCVLKLRLEPLQVLAYHRRDGETCPSDVTDTSGYTVLHKAILASWVSGVCVVLDGGADVTLEASNGFSAIHIAALKGNIDILNEIINNAQSKNIYIHESRDVETILFCAIRSGSLDCVQRIADTGATTRLITYTEPSGITITEPYHHTLSPEEFKKLNMIIHATAEVGYVDILEFLLNHDKSLEDLLNYRCPYLKDMTPVEFAAFHNRFYSFNFLLQRTFQRMQAKHKKFDPSVLLDIVALSCHEGMLTEVTKLIPDAVYFATKKGHYPLHRAIKFGKRNMILQLIKNGADLSQRDLMGNTPIDLFMEHLSKPTEFIANIFDCCIQTNEFPFHNRSCEITVDYSVLIPKRSSLYNEGQMGVLRALLKTGNNEDQRKLLAHPLVESFLYLKWKTFSTFFYMMVFLYSLFVMSLSVYIVSVFYFKDKPSHLPVPKIWNPTSWQYVIWLNLSIIITQEFSCINLAINKLVSVILTIEFWIKSGTFVLAILMSQLVTIQSPETAWRRHLATLTLVLSWLNIMMLLSKTPMSGYYMQMFWKVSVKIIKILITFLFLILMFSFCFMVQFHTHEPFEGPWAALVKTLVMMTSEFDYSGTFNKEKVKDMSSSLYMLRVVFTIFLILAAIVLMNLMIGVAVHDVQYLVLDGNLRRLEKQVGFLNSLEVSRGKKSIFHILGLYRLFKHNEVPQRVKIKLVKDEECCYAQCVKKALMNKAQEQLDKLNKQAESIKNESKLDEILQAVRILKEQNIMSQINDLTSIVHEIQKLQHSKTSKGNNKPRIVVQK